MIGELATFTCRCGIYAVGRCNDCGSYLCRDHGISQVDGWICSSGCRELERLHRLGQERLRYRGLVDQVNSIISVFLPRMAAAGNPKATQLGQPEITRRSRLIGKGTTEKVAPRGPLGWRVSSVGTGDDPESTSSVQLASIGLDISGRLLDLTHYSHEPPVWELGTELGTANGPPREYDDYDYRYLAEREIPRSLNELLSSETGSGLPDELLRCYYCGHSGFHQLSPIGALWSLDEHWPRTCEDCVQCWVGP